MRVTVALTIWFSVNGFIARYLPRFSAISGESLFLRKLVLGIPAQASGKNLTRPLMAAPPQPSCYSRFMPNKGHKTGCAMTRRDVGWLCNFTPQTTLREIAQPLYDQIQ